MNYEQPLIERRQHMRVNARGAVILRSGGREIHGRGVVVSHTSLEVRCQLGFTLLSMAGMSVEIEMRLDRDATSFVVHGQVARVRGANHSLVITLGVLPEPLARLLDAETGDAVDVPIEVNDRIASMVTDAASLQWKSGRGATDGDDFGADARF